ncbi:MAG: RICIN domain-containing protein [Lachnospiraceae bacterium]|nr:RICIN domain-containing protein [Candidatus Equihabitans merdae]
MKNKLFALILTAAMLVQMTAMPALADENDLNAQAQALSESLNQNPQEITDIISTVGTSITYGNQEYLVTTETTVELTAITSPDVNVEIPATVSNIYGDSYDVTAIADYALSGCAGVFSLAIPASVKQISFVGASLPSLTAIDLSGNENYYVSDGVVYERGAEGDNAVFTMNGASAVEEELNKAGITEDGLYYFELRGNGGQRYALDVANGTGATVDDANVDIYPLGSEPTESQLFYVTLTEDNTVKIQPYLSKAFSLDCQMRALSVFTNVRLMKDEENASNQEFIVRQSDSSTQHVVIMPANGENALTVDSISPAANVFLDVYEGFSTQEWKPVKVTAGPTKPDAAYIADGWYNINLKANSSLYLAIEGTTTADNANLALGTHAATDNSTYFYVSKVREGVYTFTPWDARSMRIDSVAGYYEPGTNLKQHTANNTAAQEFEVLKTGTSGYYQIKSTQAQTCISVPGSASTGANVELGRWTNSNNQMWKFDTSDRYLFDTNLAAGYYTIHTGVGTANSSDTSTNVMSIVGDEAEKLKNSLNIELAPYSSAGDLQQLFIEPLGNSQYLIYSALAYRGLNVASNSSEPGANVLLWDVSKRSNDIWTIKQDKDGYYRIFTQNVMKDGGALCLDVAGGKNTTGTNVQTNSEDYTTKRNLWVITGATMGNVTAGYIDLSSAFKPDRSLCMDVPGGSSDAGKQLATYTRNDGANQKWDMKLVSGGYTLTNYASGKYLSVSGDKVVQSSSAYTWKLVPNNDGTFFLQAADGRKVYAASGNSNVPLTLSTSVDTGARWYITKSRYANGWQVVNGETYYYENGEPVKNAWRGNAYLAWNGTLYNGWKICPSDQPGGVAKKGMRYYFDGRNGVLTDAREAIWNSPSVWPHITRPSAIKINRPPAGTNVETRTVTIPDMDMLLYIDIQNCTVQVFGRWPGDAAYCVPIYGFKISPGQPGYETETGASLLQDQQNWYKLGSPAWGGFCWGQYVSLVHTKDGEFIHSVACNNKNTENLDASTYNTLGTPQSHGCMRAAVRNAYWVYAFCRWGVKPNGEPYTRTQSARGWPTWCKIAPQPRMTGALPIDPTDVMYTDYYEYYNSAKENSYWGPIFWS